MKKYLSLITVGLVLTSATSARASFHLFDIREAYSNGDGSVQFIELFTTSNFQNQLSGHSLSYIVGSTTTNTLNFTTNLGSPTTANMSVLIGTANLTALYGVTPDYVIPANFFAAGATSTLDFGSGTDVINLTNLPTNGVMSLDGLVANNGTTASDTALNAQGTPTNFAGQTATIPEPSVVTLAILGLIAAARRKRS